MDVKSKHIDEALRARTQEALPEQLAEIDAIYNSAPIGLCVLDTELRWVRLNKRFAELNGVPVEDHIGKTPSQVVPDIGEQAEAAMRKILETGEPLLDLDVSGITAAQPGMRRYWNENWLPLKDRQGQIVGVSITAEEITERRQMEDDLRKSEERYKELFRHAPAGIYEIDFHGPRFKSVNDVMCHYLGYSREELLSMNPFDLLDDQGKIAFQERIRGGMTSQESDDSIEYKVKTKDGREYYTVLNSTFTYKDGKPKGAFVIAHDVTERKRAGEVLTRDQQQLEKIISERTRDLEEANLALRQSEELFYKAFHSSPAMKSITRLRDNNLIDVNNSFANALGYRREELVGHSPLEFWFDQKEREDMIRAITEKGSIESFETKFVKKSGEICNILFSLEIVSLNGDKCLLVTGIDITERMMAEEALRKSQELFSKAFDYAPYSLVITSLKDGKIKKVNQRFLLENGFTEEDVIGRSSIELNLWFNPDDRVEMLKQLQENEVVLQDFKLRKKEGEVFDVMFTGSKINIDGEECLLTIQNDITELKAYQNEMARLDRLNLIGEMAAGIGHEVRNPMTTVKGFLQLFREKKEFANYFEQLDLMVEEIDRANSIISEFLSLAKNKVIDLNRRSLNKIIKSLYPLIQTDAMKSDNNVALELEDIPMLLLDEKEMRQVILNLVRNGLEAMQPGGNLTIRTFKEEGEVVLSVQDQGTGIKAEDLEKLGTPFFTTKDNGTGLGLAVCYSLAAKHNARIDVNTGPWGTTFCFRFKVKK